MVNVVMQIQKFVPVPKYGNFAAKTDSQFCRKKSYERLEMD